VIVDPSDYQNTLDELTANQGALSQESRFKLARKSFEHTAQYDTAIAGYLNKIDDNPFPEILNLQFKQSQIMRYGENPHQKAAFYCEANAFYCEADPASGTLAAAQQLQGKALSYNNIADADAALECVKSFSDAPTCVIVKHANPCGVASTDNLLESYNRAYQTDPTSAFGGIIAFNQPLDGRTAQAIIDRQFVEVLIAPSITNDARTVLLSKPNIRVMETGTWPLERTPSYDFKRVTNGLLVQDNDINKTAKDEGLFEKNQDTNDIDTKKLEKKKNFFHKKFRK